MRILIQMAMRAEAAPVIERLGLRGPERLHERMPFLLHEGDATVSLVVAGEDPRFGVDNIGTQPAAMLAHLAIERVAPDVLLNAGTAGALASKGARIGDVYLSRAPVVYHDRRIDIPRFDAYGVGSYPAMDATQLATKLGLKTAIVSSGNALDLPACDAGQMRASGATLKDMEAAAIAWVCWMRSVPFLALKGVTDLIDGEHATAGEFLANLAHASDRVSREVVRVVDALSE